MMMDASGCPCEDRETVFSTMGLRLNLLKGTMPLVVTMDLHLEVVSSPVVGCFFWVMVH